MDDISDRKEGRVIEPLHEPQPFVERKLEGGHRRQVRAQNQGLVDGAAVDISNKKPVAQPVSEKQLLRGHGFSGRHVHTSCTAESMPLTRFEVFAGNPSVFGEVAYRLGRNITIL